MGTIVQISDPISHHKSHDSLEVGKDDETDDQGHNGQAVTHHGQVVETDGKLHRKKK